MAKFLNKTKEYHRGDVITNGNIGGRLIEQGLFSPLNIRVATTFREHNNVSGPFLFVTALSGDNQRKRPILL